MKRFLSLMVLLASACSSTGAPEERPLPPSPVMLAEQAGVALTMPPFDEVHTQWKERVAQPYVFFEHRGSRETFGNTMRALLEHAVRCRVETTGPPFGLFAEGVAPRACLPVAENPGEPGLPFSVLPSAVVAYAVISGPYPEVPRALPGLAKAMAQKGWQPRDPVCEIYLVNPAEVATYAALATEVQVPWGERP